MSLVAISPGAAGLGATSHRTLESAPLAIALGVVLSIARPYAGGVVWKARPGSEDLLSQ